MTANHLVEPALFVAQAGAWLGTGVLIGAFYFLALHWNIRMFVLGEAPLLAMALQFGRFALLAGVLATSAGHFGALPVLLVAVGITVARMATVRLETPT